MLGGFREDYNNGIIFHGLRLTFIELDNGKRLYWWFFFRIGPSQEAFETKKSLIDWLAVSV